MAGRAALQEDFWHCLACEDSSPPAVALGDGHERQTDVVVCSHCHHTQLLYWQKHLRQELYDYYGDRLHLTREERYKSINTQRQIEILKQLSHLTTGRRLLDVGCGEGHFVYTASQNGWEAQGIDLSRSAIELCKKFGAKASHTDFFDAGLSAEKFDLIIMSELIEHVPQPQRFIRRSFELLNPGGLLYLTTPNYNSLSRRLLNHRWTVIHPEHISYFTRAVLRTMGRSAGFDVVRLETKNLSLGSLRQWFKPLQVETNSQPQKSRSSQDFEFRQKISRSRWLKIATKGANWGLNLMSLGESLVGILRRGA